MIARKSKKSLLHSSTTECLEKHVRPNFYAFIHYGVSNCVLLQNGNVQTWYEHHKARRGYHLWYATNQNSEGV